MKPYNICMKIVVLSTGNVTRYTNRCYYTLNIPNIHTCEMGRRIFLKIENIPKSKALLYCSLLKDLRPNWIAEIMVEDYNLFKLGFIDEPQYSIILYVSKEEIEKLYEEIIYMEIDAYTNEDLLYKDYRCIREQEKQAWISAKEAEEKYQKYTPIETLCRYILE